jgi:hypothetical protein
MGRCIKCRGLGDRLWRNARRLACERRPWLNDQYCAMPPRDRLAGLLQIPVIRSLRLTTTAIFDAVGALLAVKKPRYVDFTSDGSTMTMMASQEVVEGWARIAPENGEMWPKVLPAMFLFSMMAPRPPLKIHQSTNSVE